MVFYFTATGNSLYVAKQLDEDRISIAQAIHDNDKTWRADAIGLVCPVFGHEVPALVREFLAGARFETEYFYLILTYGNRHGGAAELTHKLAESLGHHPAYINVVLMADNFLPGFDMNEQRRQDKHVDEQIAAIRHDINARKRYISPVTEKDRAAHQEYLDRIAILPAYTFRNVYTITDKCMGCEVCRRVCPRNCFTVTEQKSRWNGKNCMMCMACIHACPVMAIQMNMPEVNPKARYRNENIRLTEIVAANNQTQKTP